MSYAFSDLPDQSGRTVLVTGANTGIGLEIARELCARGARVLLGCRNKGKAEAAMEDIRRSHPSAQMAFVPLDLTQLASIRSAAEIVRGEARLDVLINNAGIMIPPLGHAIGGAEQQFAVNHLAHFALTALLLDKLAQSPGSRVVSQASIAHRGARIDFSNLDAAKGYSRVRFYAQSKLANLLFAFELDRRLRAAAVPVASIAVHPGVAAT